MVKDMIGYEERYTISTEGKVWNKNGKELNGYINQKGYHYIKTYDGKKHRLHRLVAQTFIPNPEEYPQVDHKDEDKSNNTIENLRWCTGEMNLDYHHEKHGKGKYNQEPKKYRAMSPEDKIAYKVKVGKAITVDGKEFISCGSAAQYIVDNIEGKNKATISKELRRYLQGKRSAWVMYDKFTIGY